MSGLLELVESELDLVSALYFPAHSEHESRAMYAFEILEPTDFNDRQCSILFAALKQSQRFGCPSDVLIYALKNPLLYEPPVEFFEWLVELRSRYVNWAFIPHLARKVYMASRIRHKASGFGSLSRDLSEINLAFTDAEGRLMGMPAIEGEASELIQSIYPPDLRKTTSSDMDRLSKEIIEKRLPPKIDTGIFDFDRYMSLAPGDMFVIGASPSSGKTTIGCQIALNVAKRGIPSLVLSLEMKRDPILMRYLCNLTSLSMKTLSNGSASDLIREASAEFKSLPIEIEDAQSDIAAISAAIARNVRQRQVKLVMVDYLQLITNREAKGSRNEEVAGISRALKMLAHEHGFALIALSQFSRGKDKPTLSSLRDSGAIEQDADEVVLVWREEEATTPRYCLAKNRQGPIMSSAGEWPLLDIDFATFTVGGKGGPKAEEIFA